MLRTSSRVARTRTQTRTLASAGHVLRTSLALLWKKVASRKDVYHPEQHYMRGPGRSVGARAYENRSDCRNFSPAQPNNSAALRGIFAATVAPGQRVDEAPRCSRLSHSDSAK